MPELCRFLGIVIVIVFKDHPPPHVHVTYGGQWASIAIEDGKVQGHSREGLAPHTLTLVRRWIRNHRAELMIAWDAAQRGKTPTKIPPTGY